MKKIIWITLIVFMMGNTVGCQKKEEQPATEERVTATTVEETEEDTVTEETEASQEENMPEPEEQDINPDGQAPADNSQPDTEAGTEAPGKDTETDAVSQSYYGKWKVTVYYAPYITAITTEEMNALIGAECEYGLDAFISKGNKLDSPQYSEGVETKADFEADWENQITFETLGITADTVKQISVDNSYDFGSTFYIRDANTIMILYEGVFFEAVKEK